MKLSKSTELAIHGLFQLANQKSGMLLVTDIAQAQNVSCSFLAKIFQKLAQGGLVRSKSGKKGGFSLARSPKKISLANVVQAVEAKEPLYDCLWHVRGCSAKKSVCCAKPFIKPRQICAPSSKRPAYKTRAPRKSVASRFERGN